MITEYDIRKTIYSLCKDLIADAKYQVDVNYTIVFTNCAKIVFDEDKILLFNKNNKLGEELLYADVDRVFIEVSKHFINIIFGREEVIKECNNLVKCVLAPHNLCIFEFG